MQILYSPDGMPTRVPASEVENYIKRGYRRNPPKATAYARAIRQKNQKEGGEAAPPPENPLLINGMSALEVKEAFNCDTATAKQVAAGIPYADIDALISVQPDIAWTTYEDRLVFDNIESKADDTEPKADNTESKADDTEPKADNTESKADNTESKADDTESKADDTAAKKPAAKKPAAKKTTAKK